LVLHTSGGKLTRQLVEFNVWVKLDLPGGLQPLVKLSWC